MLRAGWRLSENTGSKPADFELWILWVRHPLWDGEITLPKSPPGQRPRGPLAITSQGLLSVSPARSKDCSCLLLSGTDPSRARASTLPKGAKVQRLVPRKPIWPDPTAGPEGRGGREAVKEEAAPRGRNGGGAGLPDSRQPPPYVPRPPFDNFPPPRTPGLPRWRRVPSTRPSQPRKQGPDRSSSIRDSERAAPVHWLRRRRPRPSPARTWSRPAPSAAAMLTPSGAGATEPHDSGPSALAPLRRGDTLRVPSCTARSARPPPPSSVSPPGLLSQSRCSCPSSTPQTSTEFPCVQRALGVEGLPVGLFTEARAAFSLLSGNNSSAQGLAHNRRSLNRKKSLLGVSVASSGTLRPGCEESGGSP